jgi:hypothetical protein
MSRPHAPRCTLLALAALLAVLAAGCERTPRRGGDGESCTRRDDCDGELRCVALVCVRGAAPDAGAALAAGAEGDSCVSRRDCAAGLLCLSGACARASAGTEPGGRYSGVGESCRASNDCAPDLACVNSSCTRRTLSLAQTGKQCHRVECEEPDDCCADFTPNANCDAYRENCEIDPVFCNTYRSLCECNRTCEDELCVAAAPGCTQSGECTSGQTPFCVEGRCRQCERDGNCPGAGTRCAGGVCMAACGADGQCPALHECRDGECVEVGCRTDRECVFITGDALSSCEDGECRTPCDADSDCSGTEQRFHVCLQGQCVFAGCENDAECRAVLGLFSRTDTSRAVCR